MNKMHTHHGEKIKHMNQIFRLLSVVICAFSMFAHAEVTAEEAKQLGGPVLTLLGAEKTGNKEGTIPEYTGIGVKPPPSWDPKNAGQRPDPYGDKPLFSITAANAAQYAGKLDGMIEVFKRYPNFRMDIYPSHRDYVLPQYVLDNIAKNATACKAVNDELKLEGCYGGLPFPIAKTGKQVMWNHLVSYQAWTQKGRAQVWVVPPSGSPSLLNGGEYLNNWPYYDPAKTAPHASEAIYFRFLGKDDEPARLAGNQLLFIDPVDQIGVGRRAYVYAPGRRWVKLAADLNYDTPTPYGAGIATMDDSRVFLGAMDRFDFEPMGKKEKFIYYNNFQLTDQRLCTTEKIVSTKGFPNPDCVRWELHRVWVVKATLKPGFKHVYQKRMLYWDEDGYVGGHGESYDAKGKLFRISENIVYPFYESNGGYGGSNIYMDLNLGMYVASGTSNCDKCGWQPITTRIPESTFDPDAMAGAGIR
jgi:Protein of unknown function (DUF1329)